MSDKEYDKLCKNAANVHLLGFVDEPEYKRTADEIMKVLGAIQQEYAKKGVNVFGSN